MTYTSPCFIGVSLITLACKGQDLPPISVLHTCAENLADTQVQLDAVLRLILDAAVQSNIDAVPIRVMADTCFVMNGPASLQHQLALQVLQHIHSCLQPMISVASGETNKLHIWRDNLPPDLAWLCKVANGQAQSASGDDPSDFPTFH